jgi:glutamine synthetase
VLNTVVAEVLRQFADMLEKSKDFTGDLATLISKTYREHKRIIFNGNNYSEDWVAEAQRRGLSNLRTTVDARPAFVAPKSVEVFSKHQVFTETEIHSRYEILLEDYCKILHIEALTMVAMVKSLVFPACIDYQNELVKLLERKIAAWRHAKYDTSLEGHLLGSISELSGNLVEKLAVLENALSQYNEEQEILARSVFVRDKILAAMSELRTIVDELETLIAKKHWTLPSYGELLYSVV